MNRQFHHKWTVWGWMVLLAMAPAAAQAQSQRRPHIGYVYPAGGQRSTTFQVKLGGQDLDDVHQVLVTGPGVSARVVEYFRRLGNQETQLLKEQLKALDRAAEKKSSPAMAEEPSMMMEAGPGKPKAGSKGADKLAEAIERRLHEAVQTPACASINNLVWVEVTIAADAAPGLREMRLVTARGVSNPLPFDIGQLPEVQREPMISARLQVLGKEAAALRKRPHEEAEQRIKLPCTVNGQIASGEVNRYRFQARKGQHLVISTQARQLIPYVADAVPGWFQPVLGLYDAKGREVAYADDYRFKPDPVILFVVPEDGEYVFAIHDSIYRGREDFVYRISAGELPFVTSIFPKGGPAGALIAPEMAGWGLAGSRPDAPAVDASSAATGLITIAAAGRSGLRSNRVPFMLGTLPEQRDQEPNNTPAAAQKVVLPVIINGRIDQPDDWDVFEFSGKAGDSIVAEVQARRLDSPLDSVIKLTDAAGKVLAFNDDYEDLTAGTNTHHADSYLMVQLPADGNYCLHIGDTARHAGEAYSYRLRLSAPQPDFELRVVPSSVAIPIKSGATVSVYAVRKDGFSGPIRVSLNDPPPGITSVPLVIPADQMLAKLSLKGGPTPSDGPLALTVVGSATLDSGEIRRDAIPAEDKMQAFLWRHLVPAEELRALVYNPKYQPPPKRVAPVRPPRPPEPPAPVVAATPPPGTPADPAAKPPVAKFSEKQILGRLRQIKRLYEEGLLTERFYHAKVTDCEAGL